MIETFSDRDRILVRYLFNELDKNEAVELEDEMLLDDELFERAEVVEMNLIDHYLRNELTPEERLRFKTKFLAAPENRDKVDRAQLFHESLRLLHEKDQITLRPMPARSLGPSLAFVFQRPLPALASIAAAILLIAALVLVLKIPRRDNNNANTLVTGSTSPAPGKVIETTATPSPSSAPGGPASPNVPSPNNVPGGSGIALAKNARDRFTQHEYISRQTWNGGERGGRVVHINLRQQVMNLVLMYELLDDASKKETYGVTIRNQYSERIWPQNDILNEEVKPVFTPGKKRKKLIIVDVPTSVFKDDGPYLFEIDGSYLPAKNFTVKKLKAPR